MLNITPWYIRNQTLKRALSERRMICSGIWYGVCQNAVRAKRAFIIWNLTSPYVYFPKIFCQKKVKKNCKSASRVFFINADSVTWKSTERYATSVLWGFVGYGSVNLSLRGKAPLLFMPHCGVLPFMVILWWFMDKKQSTRNFYRTVMSLSLVCFLFQPAGFSGGWGSFMAFSLPHVHMASEKSNA